ncbi:FixH family protein [Radiobacillus sp. PE A8.2]|uniref:FixH family protein n=1 Tax=Radiobacillus sp. PE A8.2 TaxID=3380349 RepID=UPI00388D43CC
MKLKRLAWFISIALITFVAACGNNQNSEEENQEIPEIVEVDIQVDPEHPELNEEVTISALVTQGDENVDDAQEVMFEVWKDGQEDHEMIEASHDENGVYAISKSFDEAGNYTVISHVTARDMHTMPNIDFTVGDISEEKEQEDAHEHDDASEHESETEESTHDHNAESHDSTDLAIHFMNSETITAGQETSLMVHLQDDAPFSGASVRFEVWRDSDDVHQYLDATEENAGEYTAITTFQDAGEYNVVVHVKKDELHTHQENTVQVE